MLYTSHYASPLGGMTLVSDGTALVGLYFDGQKYAAEGLDAKRTQKKRCEPTAFTPKHTHQEENNLEISQNNNLRCLYDAAHYGG